METFLLNLDCESHPELQRKLKNGDDCANSQPLGLARSISLFYPSIDIPAIKLPWEAFFRIALLLSVLGARKRRIMQPRQPWPLRNMPSP